jgi:hypothetical protein
MKNYFIIICTLVMFNNGLYAEAISTGTAMVQSGKEVVKGAASNAAAGVVQKKGVELAQQSASGVTDSIGEFFSSPAGIAVMSGISTVLSGKLYQAAAEQEEEAKQNVIKIDKIMATFKDSFAAYCPNGREVLTEPTCYCYKEDGSQNKDRTKSQTCVDLWAKNIYNLAANAGSYSGVSQFVDSVGCLSASGQFDENCKCKKFVDAKGNNSCMKSSSINLPANSFGAGLLSNTGMRDVLKLAANSSNGNPNFNGFNSALLGLKAISGKQFNDNLLNKLGTQTGSDFKRVNNGNVLELAKSAIGPKALAAAMANSKSPLETMASGGSISPKSAELIKSAASKAGFDLSGGYGLQNKKSSPKDAMNLNFGADNANAASQTQNFPEAEKNYNYKNSDISKNSGASIFDIISNRYIQSGLKRLFEN